MSPSRFGSSVLTDQCRAQPCGCVHGGIGAHRGGGGDGHRKEGGRRRADAAALGAVVSHPRCRCARDERRMHRRQPTCQRRRCARRQLCAQAADVPLFLHSPLAAHVAHEGFLSAQSATVDRPVGTTGHNPLVHSCSTEPLAVRRARLDTQPSCACAERSRSRERARRGGLRLW